MNFQSHYGAIGTARVLFDVYHDVGLSIPLWCDWNAEEELEEVADLSSFNPTMVRLEQKKLRPLWRPSRSFQSHYGAIGTTMAATIIAYLPDFQSHYGAIGTPKPYTMTLAGSTFNPTMVRLEPVIPSSSATPLNHFQSHYGAIGTDNLLHRKPVHSTPFNPTMVRLELDD